MPIGEDFDQVLNGAENPDKEHPTADLSAYLNERVVETPNGLAMAAAASAKNKKNWAEEEDNEFG